MKQIIKNLTVPVQKQEPLPFPSENLENNVENDVQRPFSPITAIDSIAKSPSLRGGFTLVHSPIYGPLKKVETDPLTTEFRYVFKKYYKELPLYQPRVPKERPIPSIDPATYSTDENAIEDILKIRVSKFNYKDTPKQKIHTVSKTFMKAQIIFQQRLPPLAWTTDATILCRRMLFNAW